MLIPRVSDWAAALLWVDGEPVPVPRSAIGNPMCSGSVEWLDDRFVYAQIRGLWDHPQNVPGSSPLLGSVHGLMIWDAKKQVRHLELPDAFQSWVYQYRQRSPFRKRVHSLTTAPTVQINSRA